MTTATRTTEDFQATANEYAKSSIQDMREELERLQHARDCDGEEIDGEPCTHIGDDDWHDEDAAREAIEQGPLSVEVRSGWHTPGAEVEDEEYNILLGTGGPAARIIGDLGRFNQPDSARYEYQDWFKPWTAAHLSREDEATLLEYAQQFYFGD